MRQVRLMRRKIPSLILAGSEDGRSGDGLDYAGNEWKDAAGAVRRCGPAIIESRTSNFIIRSAAQPSGRKQAQFSGWAVSFPLKRESTPQRWDLYWIPAFAGMTVSLTRGRAWKMLAKKTRIYGLAMQGQHGIDLRRAGMTAANDVGKHQTESLPEISFRSSTMWLGCPA